MPKSDTTLLKSMALKEKTSRSAYTGALGKVNAVEELDRFWQN